MDNKQQQIKDAIVYFINNTEISITQCAKMFNINRGTLGSHLAKLNIEADRRRKYEYDENYFENIDTPNKAYWLGFISADGCVKRNNNLSLYINIKDIGHIEKFRTDIKGNNPINIETRSYIKKDGTNAQAAGINVCSKKLCSDLGKYGITPGKSLTLKPVEDLEVDLQKDYIRGIFDGDGWINSNAGSKEVGFCGTEEMCQFIKKYFKSIDPTLQCCESKVGNIYRIRYNNENARQKVLGTMYNKSQISLDRKYNQAKKLAVLDENH